MHRHNVEADLATRSVCPALEARVFPPKQGWTVVIWPGYFNAHDIATARALSSSLATLVVTTHEFEDAYWTLAVFDDGLPIVRFASQPGYFASSPSEARRSARKWSGPPGRLARKFRIPIEVVTPYLVPNASGKAFRSDDFPRDNFWVFTDLWRRLGIWYPLNVDGYRSVLRVGSDFLDRLPAEGEL